MRPKIGNGKVQTKKIVVRMEIEETKRVNSYKTNMGVGWEECVCACLCACACVFVH